MSGSPEMRHRKSSGKTMSPHRTEELIADYQKNKNTANNGDRGLMKEFSERGPTYLFVGLAVATVLLTIGGSFHEEPTEDQTHYNTLGIKRMCKASEIDVAYEKLKKEGHNSDTMQEIEEAYKVLKNPRSRRTYDRATPATREELYYKAVKYIGGKELSWQEVTAGKHPYLIEVHSGAARPPKIATIHNTVPNWGRLMTKTAKILDGKVKLGRINVDAESDLAQEHKLHGKMPFLIAVNQDKVRIYKGEPRILKIADFLGEGMDMGQVDQVTYGNVEGWKKESPDAVKVLLFRKSFTSMVLNYREVADELDTVGFKFGEVDVRSRGAVNLWRQFNLRRLPLVAVLRDNKNQESGVLGGTFNSGSLRNFLMVNKNPSLPRVSSENFEDSCINGNHRYCAILAVDPRFVSYKRINNTLEVFTRAKKLMEKHAQANNVNFMWADKIADYFNTTEMWKSLYTVFKIKDAGRASENFIVTDNGGLVGSPKFKLFGGNFAKVTDLSEKDTEMKEFIEQFISGEAKKVQNLPSPIFNEPPPPPYTQEDITKIFVCAIVLVAAACALAWSYVTFQKEAAIKEELIAQSGKKPKKEKRDGDYGVGED